jgi:hypothetical protein
MDFWSSVPEFKYEAPGMSWLLTQQALPLSLLALWAVMGVSAAYWSAQRIEVV